MAADPRDIVRPDCSAVGELLDGVSKHAIEGFTGAAGVMPAKGGNPALTDEQVKATVDWMVGNLQ